LFYPHYYPLMITLYETNDPKRLNATRIFASNAKITIEWEEKWEDILNECWGSDSLSFGIWRNDFEKFVNAAKEKYQDYVEDEEKCKELWWEEWNEYNELTKKILMALVWNFSVDIAYRQIYWFCWDEGIKIIDERGLGEVEEKGEDDVKADHIPTIEETEELVKERIQWFRKWTKDVPCYLHSFHVRDLLKKNWFDETVQLAWLLHDIVEDWDTSFSELTSRRYSNEVVRLVDLATHDMSTKDSFQRWKDMMKRLEWACDRNAWAIKLADICDNVNDCHTMPNIAKKRRFLFEKCPYFVEQGNKWFWWTEFYIEFLRRYHSQLERFVDEERRRAYWRAMWLITWIAFLWAACLWGYWWYVNNSSFMKLSLVVIIALGIFMGIMHIICFRLPHKND